MNWEQIVNVIVSLIAAFMATRAKSSVKTESAKTRKHVTTEMYQNRQITPSSAVSTAQSDTPAVTPVTNPWAPHE